MACACGSSTRDQTDTGGSTGSGGATGGSGGSGAFGGIQVTGGGGGTTAPTCSPVIVSDESPQPAVPSGIQPDFVESGTSPRVVVASNDEAVVAWTHGPSILWRRYRSGAWIARAAVAGSDGVESTLAGLVADADGTVALAHHEKTQGGYALCTRIARGDGTALSDTLGWTTYGWWQDPVAPLLALGVDGTHTLVTIYRLLEQGATDRVVGHVAPGLGWSSPTEIGSGNVQLLALSTRKSGGADAIWSSSLPDNPLRAASLLPTSNWSAPVSGPTNVSRARLVADALDSTLSLWVRWDQGHSLIEATPAKDGVFGVPAVLDQDVEVGALELASDGAGLAIAGWTTTTGCTPTTFFSTRDSSGDWQTPSTLADASLAGVSTAPDGRTLVLWQKIDSTSGGCTPDGLRVSWVSSLGIETVVVDASADASEPTFAVAPDGRVLVAWSRPGAIVAKWLD